MGMRSRHLVNEREERVSVYVEEKKAAEGVSGVQVSVSGSSTDSDIRMTLLEAQVVHEELGKVLRRTFKK